MSYGIAHNGKVYGPSGALVDVQPEDVDTYNRQLEAAELEVACILRSTEERREHEKCRLE